MKYLLHLNFFNVFILLFCLAELDSIVAYTLRTRSDIVILLILYFIITKLNFHIFIAALWFRGNYSVKYWTKCTRSVLVLKQWPWSRLSILLATITFQISNSTCLPGELKHWYSISFHELQHNYARFYFSCPTTFSQAKQCSQILAYVLSLFLW